MPSSSPFIAESARKRCAGLVVVVWCGLSCGGATARAPTPDAARSATSSTALSSATAGALGVGALPPPPEELYGELFNCLLHHLERSIAKGCEAQRDTSCVDEFSERASRRAAAIERYLWHARGYYGDYDWARAAPRDNLTAASLFPLFVGVASAEHAKQTALEVKARLLAPGGLLTTALETGEQWDAPNGWAPLQWVAVAGLRRYDEGALARRIGERFLARVSRVYGAQGKLVEKYDVSAEAREGGGSEYPNQDGFGWTNGVTLMLLDLYEAQAGDRAARQRRPRARAVGW